MRSLHYNCHTYQTHAIISWSSTTHHAGTMLQGQCCKLNNSSSHENEVVPTHLAFHHPQGQVQCICYNPPHQPATGTSSTANSPFPHDLSLTRLEKGKHKQAYWCHSSTSYKATSTSPLTPPSPPEGLEQTQQKAGMFVPFAPSYKPASTALSHHLPLAIYKGNSTFTSTSLLHHLPITGLVQPQHKQAC